MTSVAHDKVQATGASAPTAQVVGTPVPGGKLGVPFRPQVNLLPPEVTLRRQVATAKRALIWSIIGTLVIVAVAFMAAFFVRSEAALAQDDALATAADLTQQKREFSPVVEVMNNIKSTQAARGFVLSNEVNWASYVYALAAVLPEDVTIDTLTVAASGAGEELVEGVDALTTNAIGVMTFAATSPTLPEASEWIDAIESVPGLADANLRSSELTDDAGKTTYTVASTAQVTLDALALRTFADEAEAPAAADAPTDEAAAAEPADATAEGGE